jgi:membrane associated rhomboid family serine protease
VVLEPVLIYFLHRLIIRVPAWIFLPVWFFLQIFMALKQHGSNVAFWSHVGGFLSGAIMTVAVYKYTPKHILYATESKKSGLTTLEQEKS